MATAQLGAKARSGTGKGVARKLRQAGEIPGVIYGHGRAPQALTLNAREFDRLLSTVSVSSTVIELSFDGGMSRTLVREIQRHQFKKQIIHVDFQELVAGEKVTVDVPIVFIGTADGVKNSGGILDQVMHAITVHCDPSNIPNHIDVDVTPLAIGKSFHVSDLSVPQGVEVLSDPEATICIVSAPKASETPAAGVEVVEAAAEPELIRKTKEGEEEGEES